MNYRNILPKHKYAKMDHLQFIYMDRYANYDWL